MPKQTMRIRCRAHRGIQGAIPPDAGTTGDFPLVHLPEGREMIVRVACTVVREGLTEYLDEALPPERRQGFVYHLSSCSECRTLLDEIDAVPSRLARLPRESMPPAMRKSIWESFCNRFGENSVGTGDQPFLRADPGLS